MQVVFQIEKMSELEEISQWLAKRKIVIQKVTAARISADALFTRLRRYRINLPPDYRFNRDEANER